MHTSRLALTLAFLFMLSFPGLAQMVERDSLQVMINTCDSLLFDEGFNKCDLTRFETLVSDNFEFYHDEAGTIFSKSAFVESVRKNICGQAYKPVRYLAPSSMRVYPLTDHGKLYGAVQEGIHRFYAREQGKPEYFTSRASFTHLWKLENGAWKLARSISYDHQTTDTALVPDFTNSVAVTAWMRQYKVPALGIGYIENGVLRQVSMYGDLDNGRPAPYNAIFNVASITKTITAVTILKLVTQGKWDLDEPLANYFTDPDVAGDVRSKKLTTRHILNQQSGFPNWRYELPGGKLVFQFAPGTQYRYSGEGFEYLRHAVEHKFHKTLDVLAAELVFTPLGMYDTHFTWGNDIDSSRLAIPHDADGKPVKFYRNKEANAADLVTTTIADLSKFLVSVMNGDGLSEKVRKDMFTPAVKTKDDRYIGLCWFLYGPFSDGSYAVSHGGDDRGVHTICFMLPESKNGLIIFTNSDNGSKLYADIIRSYLGKKGQRIIDIEMK